VTATGSKRKKPAVSRHRVPAHLVCEIAARHKIDPRTLARALRGDTIRGQEVAERAKAAASDVRSAVAAGKA
jgi:hypothetical protein